MRVMAFLLLSISTILSWAAEGLTIRTEMVWIVKDTTYDWPLNRRTWLIEGSIQITHRVLRESPGTELRRNGVPRLEYVGKNFT